jgi:hypothetical protein
VVTRSSKKGRIVWLRIWLNLVSTLLARSKRGLQATPVKRYDKPEYEKLEELTISVAPGELALYNDFLQVQSKLDLGISKLKKAFQQIQDLMTAAVSLDDNDDDRNKAKEIARSAVAAHVNELKQTLLSMALSPHARVQKVVQASRTVFPRTHLPVKRQADLAPLSHIAGPSRSSFEGEHHASKRLR